MKCELCFDNDCLDLPSLTQIQGNDVWIHRFMGYVILESIVWFDLIWIDIPNLTENNIHYGKCSFEFTADLQSTSTFPFHLNSFSRLDADGLRDFIITHSQYNVVQEGMQSKERYFVPPNQSIENIPNDIQHLYFYGFKDYVDKKLVLGNNSFHQLKSITIGNHCFQNVREFVIDGLERLESVKIGDYCFRIDYEERDDGVCRITNCPNLRQLEIGDYSFVDFQSFEISNLNSLQSIYFGYECFCCADFSLKGEWKERKKDMWLEWKWKWYFRSSIIRNRYI